MGFAICRSIPAQWQKHKEGRSRTCKPGSVESDHFSRTAVARRLQQPTRKWWRTGPIRAGASLRLLPVWSCSQWGLPCQSGHPLRGALLPHLFTLTGRLTADLRRTRQPHGGLFSVALSRSSRMVGVTHHCVLWSPDFPRPRPGRIDPAQPQPRSLGSLRPAFIVRRTAQPRPDESLRMNGSIS